MEGSESRDQSYRAVFLARSADEVRRRYLDRLLRLRDEGFEVDVLAGDTGGFDELRDAGIEARPIPVRHPHNVAGLLGAYFIVQAHLLERRPMIVHSFGHRVAWLGTYAARRAQVPAVFATMEYHWLEEEPLRVPLGPLTLFGASGLIDTVTGAEEGINNIVGTPFRRTMHRAYRWLADAVDRYIVTTEFDMQLLQDMEIAADDKLEMAIGGAGVDLQVFSLPEKGDPMRQEARNELELPDHWRQVVGWAGPVTRRHGADDLLAAISKLKMTHPSVGFLVVVRGPLASGQARRLRRLEKRGQVRLIRDVDDEALVFRAMDVLAWFGHPSTPHDAISQAAALAVPTVGYDTPAARSLVEQGQTGHLVFEDERRAAIGTLGKMLNDPKRLSDLGWRARSRANLRFSRRAVDDQMVRLYDRVLDQVLRQPV